MKAIYTILTSLLISGTIQAQEAFQKTFEDPNEVIKGHVGVEIYGVDAGFKNLSGAMLFAIGVNARYPISEKISAEGLVRFPLLRFEKKGFSFTTDAGILYTVKSEDAVKPVRIILGYKETDNLNSNTRTSTVKYLDVNGMVRKNTYLRGGIYLRNSAFEYKEDEMTDYFIENIFHKGIYLGVGRERQYFFKMQKQKGNETVGFGAGSIFMVYGDVMILPVSVNLQQDTFGLGGGATKEVDGLLGGRVGFKWYRNPFTKEQNFGRRLPFFGNSVFSLETGVRPLDGLFISGSLTYIIYKF
ncbi:MAG: hypothetical protein O9302_11645 [Cyclobacteriaceae bacterium]|jgi:hypothetical protein|nr:hypothetical protein [Cytophagales bacterium]MCZ8328707.1 hypothetical protein [Cyclobacteriaceae bacterium]